VVFERMKPYALSAFLLLLVVYLGVQALTGERGLLSGSTRDARLTQRATQLATLKEQRADLEVRVRYLRTGSLSRDLLEERASAVLGFSDPRDYVIHIATPPVRTTTATRS
jgi:cell division protein FtsB